MHADRTNRLVLALFGFLLLAAGVAGILAGTGVFGSAVDRRTVLDNPVAAYIGDNSNWFWPVAAVVAVILAVLALRWLIAVLSPAPHARNIVIAGDHSTGRTTLTAGALDDALTADIETYRGVHSARARVYGDSSAPRLHVTVGLDRDADLAALRHRIETSALEHARHALDEPQLPIRLELAVTRYRTGRVT